MEHFLIDHVSNDHLLTITGQTIIHYNYNQQLSIDTNHSQNDRTIITETLRGIKRKSSTSSDDMQQQHHSSFHHLHHPHTQQQSSHPPPPHPHHHQYDTLPMQQQTTTNVVTLHPSATILLSGPLAGSNSSQQQQQTQSNLANYYVAQQQQHYVTNYHHTNGNNQYSTTASPTPPTQQHYQANTDKTTTAKDRHKRVRCKQCEPCCRDDCSECVHCKDMPKFGGVGKMKQCCLTKQCIAPILPSTASCQVCSKKKGSRKLSQLKPEEILYECERCMEIHHLPCFHTAHPDSSTSEGVFSDDIPETWLCPKCITANTPEPPLYKLRPIVRRTLVTTNKGKNGLIELPYSDPSQQQQQQQMNVNHHLLQQQQQPQHHSLAQPLPISHSELHHLHHGHLDLHHLYATGGGNSNPNVNLGGLLPNHNDLHCDLYTDPYEAMENEAKKRCLYATMYAPNGNGDSSGTTGDPSSSINGGSSNNGLVGLDDLSTSLNDSDLYVPQMFAV
ncbi:unnamed protein product [Rotaria sordida]|uniref:PHD-type domain-containing protein n=1 Tax=Rotaria sordida TaxID=392033 RepID=A0A813UQ46_9BILA|nr:unnamed protein product [Rotaria sordida]CAF0855829.1 unnamed protein product [Rotaria sordida]